MTVPEEGEQVVEKLAQPGGLHVIVQVQFADTAAQVNPEILLVEYAKLFAVADQENIAILMKGRELQSGEVGSTQFLFHPLPHFLGCILGVSDGQDFIGPGVPFTNQMGDAFGEDGGLSRTRAGDDQNWTVDVFDRLGADVRPVRLREDVDWILRLPLAGEYQSSLRIFLRRILVQL